MIGNKIGYNLVVTYKDNTVPIKETKVLINPFKSAKNVDKNKIAIIM
jgi:hypothetical protein